MKALHNAVGSGSNTLSDAAGLEDYKTDLPYAAGLENYKTALPDAAGSNALPDAAGLDGIGQHS